MVKISSQISSNSTRLGVNSCIGEITLRKQRNTKHESAHSDIGAKEIKGTQCFVHLNRKQQFKTKKYSLLLCKKLSFLRENLRLLRKYETMGPMETI